MKEFDEFAAYDEVEPVGDLEKVGKAEAGDLRAVCGKRVGA